MEVMKKITNERWEDRTSARRHAERSDALAGQKSASGSKSSASRQAKRRTETQNGC